VFTPEVSGGKNKVEIDSDILKNHKDIMILHNPEGGTFSDVDVYNILEFDVKEMILITFNYVYTIQRPLGGWQFSKSRLKKMIKYAESWANDSITFELQKENIDITGANSEKSHYIWTVIFQILNVNYSRKKYSQYIKQNRF
jgi:hypothetical protein